MKVYKTLSDPEALKFYVMEFYEHPCFTNLFSLHETIPQSKKISTQLCRCYPRIPINQFDIHFYFDQMGLFVEFNGSVGLEISLGRQPLQRMICCLHFNELTFRYLFENSFGKTTDDLTKLNIVKYQQIGGNVGYFLEIYQLNLGVTISIFT